MLRSDLCDFSDAYIFFKGKITFSKKKKKKKGKQIAFKNNAPFASCILKINNTLMQKTWIL